MSASIVMSTSMTGYDTSATVYPTPQYGYEGEISSLLPAQGSSDSSDCVQVTPGRRAGEEFSTSQLTTSNCRARDLRQRDTTTTIIGEAAVTRRNMSGNPHLSSSVMANLRPSCQVLIPAERS